jgi:pimeloyl-ACP methyl ester carboxylesterase
MMRRTLGFFVSSIYLLWVIGLTIILAADYQILNPDELLKLKEGKNFWEWTSNHGRLQVHYIEKGQGNQHIILLHGFRAHTYTWRHLMEPLVAAGYHVWAMDLVGYGLSDKPDHVSYEAEFFIEQIHAFMEYHQLADAHVVGNSMGGGLALNLALMHPEKVKTLTLISALGYPLDLPIYLTIGRHFNKIWVHFLGPSVIRMGLHEIVYNKNIVTDEQVEAYSLPYRFPGGALASLLTLRKFDNEILLSLSKNYHQIKQPLLVIWGDHDSLIPVSHYEKFCTDFPQAQRLLISNCGHIAQEEEPKLVTDALLNFLQQTPL